jgi:xylulokinase
MAWIAIDAGTSVIKAVAFSSDGKEFALARRQTAVLHPEPAWSEQDMEAVWRAVTESVREVTAKLNEPIEGIVCTAQGDGAWLIDESGNPTGNAILWNDGRAATVVGQWQQDGVIEAGFRISGSVTYPGLPNAILAWLRKHDPERHHRTRWVLTCNGWIFSKLTGRICTDLSDGSNPFCDVIRRRYSEQVIEIFGLQGQQHLLPPLVTGSDTFAYLAQEPSHELGIPAGTRCVMAPYDIITTAYGVGACVPGQACVILGTTICAEAITAHLGMESTPSGTTIALHDGNFLRAMPTLTGCEVLDWTARMLEVANLDGLGNLASTAPPGAGGVFFLPYLSPAGERSPFLDVNARGSFHGLSLRHTRAEIARAVFEALAYVIRECLHTATQERFTELRVCGGGARSDMWCQLIADVTGVPVLRTSDAEIGARGAYLFALELTKEAESIREAALRHVHIAARFHPDADRHSLYQKLYDTFLALRRHAVLQWQIGATI